MRTEQERRLDDGIYDVTGIPFLVTNEDAEEGRRDTEVEKFKEAYPDFVVGHAYETYNVILLASKPEKYKGKWEGSGFNYGSTNILHDCPKSLLILAEND